MGNTVKEMSMEPKGRKTFKLRVGNALGAISGIVVFWNDKECYNWLEWK